MTQATRPIPMPTSGRQRRGVLAPVLGMVALGFCGLVVLGLLSNSVGGTGVVVGALCAQVRFLGGRTVRLGCPAPGRP